MSDEVDFNHIATVLGILQMTANEPRFKHIHAMASEELLAINASFGPPPAPKATPAPIVDTLNNELEPDTKRKI